MVANNREIMNNIKMECAWCGQLPPSWFTIDHIIPRSEGGNDDPKNLQYLCSNCHFNGKNKGYTKGQFLQKLFMKGISEQTA
jgi:5-methylcytosine-specific restriction endonuclease McrA